MRLIDADAVEKVLRDYADDVGCNRGEYELANGILKAVSKLRDVPTAYDPEKVKKEIDRVGKSFCDYVACNEECTSCEHHSIMNAVTGIVRKGGAE